MASPRPRVGLAQATRRGRMAHTFLCGPRYIGMQGSRVSRLGMLRGDRRTAKPRRSPRDGRVRGPRCLFVSPAMATWEHCDAFSLGTLWISRRDRALVVLAAMAAQRDRVACPLGWRPPHVEAGSPRVRTVIMTREERHASLSVMRWPRGRTAMAARLPNDGHMLGRERSHARTVMPPRLPGLGVAFEVATGKAAG